MENSLRSIGDETDRTVSEALEMGFGNDEKFLDDPVIGDDLQRRAKTVAAKQSGKQEDQVVEEEKKDDQQAANRMRGFTKIQMILDGIQEDSQNLEDMQIPNDSEVIGSMVFSNEGDKKKRDTIATQGSVNKDQFLDLIEQSRQLLMDIKQMD